MISYNQQNTAVCANPFALTLRERASVRLEIWHLQVMQKNLSVRIKIVSQFSVSCEVYFVDYPAVFHNTYSSTVYEDITVL